MVSFIKGREFTSYEEFLHSVKELQDTSCAIFNIKNSEKVEKANLKRKCKVPAEFVISRAQYVCSHFGSPRIKGGSQKRSKTNKLGCEASFVVAFDDWKKRLVITHCKLQHNHPATNAKKPKSMTCIQERKTVSPPVTKDSEPARSSTPEITEQYTAKLYDVIKKEIMDENYHENGQNGKPLVREVIGLDNNSIGSIRSGQLDNSGDCLEHEVKKELEDEEQWKPDRYQQESMSVNTPSNSAVDLSVKKTSLYQTREADGTNSLTESVADVTCVSGKLTNSSSLKVPSTAKSSKKQVESQSTCLQVEGCDTESELSAGHKNKQDSQSGLMLMQYDVCDETFSAHCYLEND